MFNDLINLQIKEPLKEKELIKSLTSLNEITDQYQRKFGNNMSKILILDGDILKNIFLIIFVTFKQSN